MTRYARVGEGRKRPLEATEWKDMKKQKVKKPKKDSKPRKNTSENGSVKETASVENKLIHVNAERDDKTSIEAVELDKEQVSEEGISEQYEKESGKEWVKSHAGKMPNLGQKKYGKKRKDPSEMQCYNCHKKGHKVSDCPEPSDGKMDNVTCFKCKQKGHKSFRCPNTDSAPEKRQTSSDSNLDFRSFSKDFRHRWEKKNEFQKALIEAWKAQQKDSDKNFNQFKKVFRQSWCKKTGFNKALRDEWKKHGKELKQELRKQERSEERRQKRQEKRETEQQCFNCRGSGHQLSECPELKKDVDQGTGICFKCGSTEHAVNKCPVKLPDGQFPYAKCFICGETGHITKQCPDNPRGLYPNGGCCKVCGSVEHLKKDCPEMQKKQGIGSMTLTTIDSSKSGDWEDIKQRKPNKRPGEKTGPKVVKF